MAGGTGGHIFPALATAQILHDQGVHIEWLGTKKGLESKLVPEHQYPINYIDIGGVRGKNLATRLLLPFKLMRALGQTLVVYYQVKPDVVLGMGGFVTGSGGVVAWLLRKPLVLHEQNAIAGLTNSLLFKLAKNVYTAFPKAFLEHKKLTVVGNPVRRDITQIAPPKERLTTKWAGIKNKQLNILVIGGSLGATILNEVLPQALESIARKQALPSSCFETTSFETIRVRHQCGANNVSQTRDNYQWLKGSNPFINVEIMPFIDDMAKNYEWADCLICRSGALTVSEIASVGIASILVPYAHAVDDHQTANANYLVNEDAAFLIPQRDLDAQKLAQLLMTMNQEKLLTMAIKARQLAKNNAAEMVAEKCLYLAGSDKVITDK